MKVLTLIVKPIYYLQTTDLFQRDFRRVPLDLGYQWETRSTNKMFDLEEWKPVTDETMIEELNELLVSELHL